MVVGVGMISFAFVLPAQAGMTPYFFDNLFSVSPE